MSVLNPLSSQLIILVVIWPPALNFNDVQDVIWGLPRCIYLFVSFARAGVYLSFNGLLALLFSLIYAIREFDRFSHRGSAVICPSVLQT